MRSSAPRARSLALTTAWQQVSVGYTPQAPGASTLDYSAYAKNGVAAGSRACSPMMPRSRSSPHRRPR